MSKEAKLAGGTHTYTPRLMRARWEVDRVGRETVVMGGELTRLIHPHPCHRSPAIGNPTVCERRSFSCSTPDLSGHIDTPAVPGGVQKALPPLPNEGKPSGADQGGSNSKPLASSAAKLFLRGVKESADAFPPLKSVAGGLCYILDNCEVRPSSGIHYAQRLQVP